jgi:hypothetical protein
MNMCKVRVEIPFNPMTLQKGAIFGSEIDDTGEKMAHVALPSLCECSLSATADIPIVLFPIRDQEDPTWQKRLKTVCDLEIPHFSAGWVVMAK